MGLFVTEDGHFQGWLAAFLCCCAAVSDDETPIEKEKSRPVPRPGVCNEQPLSLTSLPSIPVAQSQPAHNDDEALDLSCVNTGQTPYVSKRPPSLKPLDLGETSLLSRLSWSGKQKGSAFHGSRPSISAPQAFRRLDHTDAQKQSLVPLRLGPVILRESPIPPGDDATPDQSQRTVTRDRSDSMQDLLSNISQPDSSRRNRETPFQRCQQRSSTMWPLPPEPLVSNDQSLITQPEERYQTRPPMAARSRSSSSSRWLAGETSSSSTTSRPSGERLRPKRKRSFQSVRKSSTEWEDQDNIEKEIVELNTIVEERRADAGRANVSDQHIAAVAPSMQIRARSETLDAIGSALSRPVTARDLPRPSSTLDATLDRHPRGSTLSTNRVSSRVSGWLSGIFPSSSTPHLPVGEPFYKCHPPPRAFQRSYSESSITTYLTEMDSPSLTAASSPTSKGHSRSHTGESRMTAMLSNARHEDSDRQKAAGDQWPVVMTPTSEVGLAL